jgi:hypothetical protein
MFEMINYSYFSTGSYLNTVHVGTFSVLFKNVFLDLDNRLLVDQGESLQYETDEYFIHTSQSATGTGIAFILCYNYFRHLTLLNLC